MYAHVVRYGRAPNNQKPHCKPKTFATYNYNYDDLLPLIFSFCPFWTLTLQVRLVCKKFNILFDQYVPVQRLSNFVSYSLDLNTQRVEVCSGMLIRMARLNKIDVNYSSDTMWRAFFYVSLRHDLDTVTHCVNILSKGGINVMAYRACTIATVKKGRLDVIKKYISHMSDTMSLAQMAIEYNKLDMFKWLVNNMQNDSLVSLYNYMMYTADISQTPFLEYVAAIMWARGC